MYKYPYSPEPHNLLGILLEKEGKHVEAMKHFRAYLDLDPTYCSALRNIMVLDPCQPDKKIYAYDNENCDEKETEE